MTGPLAKTILHFLWEGALIALLLAVAVRTARSARVRYALACAALLAMPMVFLITFFVLIPHAAVPVPQGRVDLTVDWTTTPDVIIARWLSCLSLLVLTGLWLRNRRVSRARLK